MSSLVNNEYHKHLDRVCKDAEHQLIPAGTWRHQIVCKCQHQGVQLGTVKFPKITVFKAVSFRSWVEGKIQSSIVLHAQCADCGQRYYATDHLWNGEPPRV